MKKKIGAFLPLLTLLALASCAPRCNDTTLYQSNGRQKPIVAVLPVIDSRVDQYKNQEARGITWNISQELTDQIRNKIADSSQIYLLKYQGNEEIAKQLNTLDNRQLANTFSKGINGAEFVVVTELVNEEERKYTVDRFDPRHTSKGEIAEILCSDFRLRVYDMRGAKPKVVLQEMFHGSHFIPRPEAGFDYSKSKYGSSSFLRTPMGQAHNKLTREVVTRVEAYIQAYKG